MAYSTTNPPRLMIPAMGGPLAANSTSVGAGGALWAYRSSVDQIPAVCTPGYFTNGKQLGMRVGDWIMGTVTSTESSTGFISFFGTLGSTNSTAGYNVSTDSVMTSTFG